MFSITAASGTHIPLYNTTEVDFEGWYLEDDFSGGRYDKGTLFPLNDNTKFYGNWTSVKVTTPAELYNIKNNLGLSYRLRDNISLAGYNNWTPLGNNSLPFKGIIYGNGHKISDLRITSTAGSYVGLFGYMEGASLYNLSVSAHISILQTSVSDLYAGIIVGYADGGSIIKNCSVSGQVSASHNSRNVYAGGVAGRHTYGTIKRCASAAIVSATVSASSSEIKAYAGGIAGESGGAISESCATGNVTSTHYAGGVAGRKTGGDISNSYYKYGTVLASSSSNTAYAGGIAAYLGSSEIVNSYTAGGTIRATNSSVSATELYAGGIAGYVDSYGTIDKSYSIVGVEAVRSGNIAAAGLVHTGSIAGVVKVDGLISNSAAASAYITATGTSPFRGRVAGKTDSVLSNNLANEDMDLGSGFTPSSQLNGKDGLNTPGDNFMSTSTFTNDLHWDFGSAEAAPWGISGNQFPALYWE